MFTGFASDSIISLLAGREGHTLLPLSGLGRCLLVASALKWTGQMFVSGYLLPLSGLGRCLLVATALEWTGEMFVGGYKLTDVSICVCVCVLSVAR